MGVANYLIIFLFTFYTVLQLFETGVVNAKKEKCAQKCEWGTAEYNQVDDGEEIKIQAGTRNFQTRTEKWKLLKTQEWL